MQNPLKIIQKPVEDHLKSILVIVCVSQTDSRYVFARCVWCTEEEEEEEEAEGEEEQE